LPREKEWSTLACEPIVQVVHCLIRWYDWREGEVARNGGQRIYGADCEHRLAGGEVVTSVPRRESQPRAGKSTPALDLIAKQKRCQAV
jgi:hypothetical protein